MKSQSVHWTPDAKGVQIQINRVKVQINEVKIQIKQNKALALQRLSLQSAFQMQIFLVVIFCRSLGFSWSHGELFLDSDTL